MEPMTELLAVRISPTLMWSLQSRARSEDRPLARIVRELLVEGLQRRGFRVETKENDADVRRA